MANSQSSEPWPRRHPWLFFFLGIALGFPLGWVAEFTDGAVGIPDAKPAGEALNRVVRKTFDHGGDAPAQSRHRERSPSLKAQAYDGGWGPSRKFFQPTAPSPTAAFNSIRYSDGDQKDFVWCYWANQGAAQTFNELHAYEDATLRVRVNIENASTKPGQAIRQARMDLSFEQKRGAVGVSLSGRKPVTDVWDGCRVWSDKGKPEMNLVPGSGRVVSKGFKSSKWKKPVAISDAVIWGKAPLPAQAESRSQAGVIRASRSTYGYILFDVVYSYGDKTKN